MGEKGPITHRLRELRKNSTPAEKLMWVALRNRRLIGFKFRRQHYISYASANNPWSFYIADFYCPEMKLAIELDGNIHDDQLIFDAFRDEMLNGVGIRVIRFRNDELTDMPRVLDQIVAELRRFDKQNNLR